MACDAPLRLGLFDADGFGLAVVVVHRIFSAANLRWWAWRRQRLQSGVLVEASADLDKAMTDGASPLLMSARKGYVDVVRVLVKANADLEKADTTNGATPLLMSARNQRTRMPLPKREHHKPTPQTHERRHNITVPQTAQRATPTRMNNKTHTDKNTQVTQNNYTTLGKPPI